MASSSPGVDDAPPKQPGKPLVRFVNVSKRFGDFVAIDNLSLDIYEGEFFSLLGPSGCGKTTLMRMIAGFDEPSEGQVLLNETSLVGVPPNKRPVNMMFQSYALFPHMTVEKNIAFGLKQDALPAADIKTRVAEMLALVKLQDFAGRKPDQLSGGQRQRVALARSLAKKPKLLLLDEPLGALDKKLREETQFELMAIQEDLGMTFIIVTHDQEEAMTVSDRVAVMRHGRLAQVAPPSEVYENPNSRYVADFIGDVNLLEGKVTSQGNGSVTLGWSGSESDINAVAPEGSAREGKTTWFAIRPEKIRLSKQSLAEKHDNVVRGIVWDIGYLGNVSTYHVKLPDGTVLKAQESNLNHMVDRKITWDDEVWLYWSRDAGVVLWE